MNWIAKQEEEFERNRFGWMSFMIIAQACLAGVVAYLSILENNWFFVTLLAITNMGALSMFLAQASAKICLIRFYISVVTSTVLVSLIGLLYHL